MVGLTSHVSGLLSLFSLLGVGGGGKRERLKCTGTMDHVGWVLGLPSEIAWDGSIVGIPSSPPPNEQSAFHTSPPTTPTVHRANPLPIETALAWSLRRSILPTNVIEVDRRWRDPYCVFRRPSFRRPSSVFCISVFPYFRISVFVDGCGGMEE